MLGLELTSRQNYELLPKLQDLYDTIYLIAYKLPDIIEKYDLITHPDERQAEIKGTEILSIQKRFKIHTEALNALRISGFSETKQEQMRLF